MLAVNFREGRRIVGVGMFDHDDVVLGREGNKLTLLSLLHAAHRRSDTIVPACKYLNHGL